MNLMKNLFILWLNNKDKVLYVIHGKIDVTANLAVSAVHSNKDMETPRRGIK